MWTSLATWPRASRSSRRRSSDPERPGTAVRAFHPKHDRSARGPQRGDVVDREADAERVQGHQRDDEVRRVWLSRVLCEKRSRPEPPAVARVAGDLEGPSAKSPHIHRGSDGRRFPLPAERSHDHVPGWAVEADDPKADHDGGAGRPTLSRDPVGGHGRVPDHACVRAQRYRRPIEGDARRVPPVRPEVVDPDDVASGEHVRRPGPGAGPSGNRERDRTGRANDASYLEALSKDDPGRFLPAGQVPAPRRLQPHRGEDSPCHGHAQAQHVGDADLTGKQRAARRRRFGRASHHVPERASYQEHHGEGDGEGPDPRSLLVRHGAGQPTGQRTKPPDRERSASGAAGRAVIRPNLGP